MNFHYFLDFVFLDLDVLLLLWRFIFFHYDFQHNKEIKNYELMQNWKNMKMFIHDWGFKKMNKDFKTF